MAKKTDKSEKTGKKPSGEKLLEAARKHQDALMAAGLHEAVLERYATALKGLAGGPKELTVAVDTLQKDIHRDIEEFQGAMRKEFPNNAAFLAFFKAGEPIPADPHGLLALGREIAKTAPDFAANLIKYALNASSVKHLSYLCDELEKEIGGADPARAATEAEDAIREAAGRAFEGKPELAAFSK